MKLIIILLFLLPLFSSVAIPPSTFLPLQKNPKAPYNSFIVISSRKIDSTIIIHAVNKNSKKYEYDFKSDKAYRENPKYKNFVFSEFYKEESNKLFEEITVTIDLQTQKELRIAIRNANKDRFEIPEQQPFVFESSSSKKIGDFENADYHVEIQNDPLAIKITRIETAETVFDTSVGDLILSDKYLEINSELPSEYIFGLGERTAGLKLKIPGKYTIWNQDLPGKMNVNTYGLHPVYLAKEKSGFYNMVFFRNGNAMDIELNNINSKEKITYKTIGGILDFKIFLGDSHPENVVKMYHKYLGGYAIQPFWAFGFHQSRWGYSNSSILKEVVDKFEKNQLPLDAIWMDIDYMIEKRDFTIDENRYDLHFLNYELKEKNKKLVLILDPGIATVPKHQNKNIYKNEDSFKPFYEGKNMNVFLKGGKHEFSAQVIDKIIKMQINFFFNLLGLAWRS